MKTFSRKPTNEQVKDEQKSSNHDSTIPLEKKPINRFSGMAERIVMLTPEIIPGYKIR